MLMLRWLYPYWRPARRDTLGGIGLLLLAGVLELLLPWPIKWLVDYVFGGRPAPAALVRLGFSTDPGRAIAWVCLAILVLGVTHKAMHMLSQFLLIRAGLLLVQGLRCHASDHLHRLSLRYHDRTKVGDSIYRAAYDSYAAQSLLSGVVAPMTTGVVILAGILAVMARLDAVLTAIALAVAPLLGLTIWGFGRGIERLSKRYHEQESALFSTMQETLSSIRFVQAYTREAATSARVGDQVGRSLASSQRLALTQLAFSACVGLTMAAGTAAAVYVGAWRVIEGRLLPGDVLVFLAYLGMLYTPVNAFAQSSAVLRSARTQLARVFEILATVPEVADRPGALELPHVRGHVEFRGVGFAYEPGQWVMRALDVVVPPGSLVAIVGRTGAGKSTLASLLLRFYDPDEGAVSLDGHDLRGLRLDWLRRHVSLVLQDAILLSGTIAENIGCGRHGATREQIVNAARRAQADEFIQTLPDGYETMLGERGVNLSGGQRQRLALARAFLKDAPLLVLDEPTSALDAQTEDALLESMRTLVRDRTTFVIAHRLSTIRGADLILVLDEGRVVERGSHEMLMSRDTAYRRLYQTHWRGEEGAQLDDPVEEQEPVETA
jgi:ATP-binding cassette subfamily B protein/subfamily B ATP-binding cassette protein MsbA